jgi:hypothetical protein
MTSEGKQTFISPYNKGHKLFIIPKLHTQQQNIFFLTNYSICVVVYVDGYISVIRKMRIETKHSTTWEMFFCVQLYGVVCFFQVRISFYDDVAMGARGSGIHDIYFPGARGLGIHVLSSWHVTFFN